MRTIGKTIKLIFEAWENCIVHSTERIVEGTRGRG